MERLICIVALALGASAWSGRAAGQLVDGNGVDLMRAQNVFTLTNLHPDEARSRLYAVNFQQPGLIPRCTRVRLTRLKRSELSFVVVERNREYQYLNHDAAAEPFKDHLLRFFGAACNPADVERLSEIDQRGIRAGQALAGMSRQGVIWAIGYPPHHVNPSLEVGDWTYWRNRFDRFIVQFDDKGIVTGIRN
jgi:hypothetical protein